MTATLATEERLISRLARRLTEMARRGISKEEYALIVSNNEALEIVRNTIYQAPISGQLTLHEVLASGNARGLSGKMKFHGVVICVI